MNNRFKTGALCAAIALSFVSGQALSEQYEASNPNILILYADDLGYGDPSSYGGKIDTPNIDALAESGIRFTDAHSPAATCTPSRYSLMTGEHAFRINTDILEGNDPLIIRPDQPTIAKMMLEEGYKTAYVGKWHLGIGDGKGDVDWNQPFTRGANDVGFEYSFLLPVTNDRVPTVFTENDVVLGLDPNDPIYVNYDEPIGDRPNGMIDRDSMRQKADLQHSGSVINGISRIGWQQGGVSAEFVDEEVSFEFAKKAYDFIDSSLAEEKPFFLFFGFTEPHVPRVPHAMFEGKSGQGPRGDSILQLDYVTGQIIQELKDRDIYDNTIIIFTSDNGPVLNDGYLDGAPRLLNGHTPWGELYGYGGKYSAYEASTRVPTIISYPNGIKKGGESDALFSHIDFYRSFANLLSVDLEDGEAIDSQDVLDALLDSSMPARKQMIQESFTLSVRDGNWKYVQPQVNNNIWIEQDKHIDSGLFPHPQLFNLKVDLQEQNNLASEKPERVKKMQAMIDKVVARK
ncbi:arylsulfatase [Vibrio sp. ZSDE26]|uniref:Arylsulfatase n=1 Tax=Vibrio amylolyticus TaxID=2847292 RepID=A0A9X2BH21_9VIBR|nr:arylsulfatase [Vibrio amylolyticus]MCK6262490.1 arylsulfatase [Vibrio amylolyticus]